MRRKINQTQQLINPILFFFRFRFPFPFLFSVFPFLPVKKSPRFVSITPHHPKYSPSLDKFRNKFLPYDVCCICKIDPIKVVHLNCGHGLCVEDMKGYLDSALGDISQFPLKVSNLLFLSSHI